MEMLETYIVSVLRKIRIIRICRKSKSLRGCMQMWLGPRSYGFDLRQISALPKDSHIQTGMPCRWAEIVWLACARYDLLFPHFIDPPFYTNKSAVPSRLPTPEKSYPNATGRSPLFPCVGFGNRWHFSAHESSARNVFTRAETRAGTR